MIRAGRIWTAGGVQPRTRAECVEPWVCGLYLLVSPFPVLKLTWGV